jgi:hypothetical protein
MSLKPMKIIGISSHLHQPNQWCFGKGWVLGEDDSVYVTGDNRPGGDIYDFEEMFVLHPDVGVQVSFEASGTDSVWFILFYHKQNERLNNLCRELADHQDAWLEPVAEGWVLEFPGTQKPQLATMLLPVFCDGWLSAEELASCAGLWLDTEVPESLALFAEVAEPRSVQLMGRVVRSKPKQYQDRYEAAMVSLASRDRSADE